MRLTGRLIFLTGVFIKCVGKSWRLVFQDDMAFLPSYREADAIIGDVRRCAAILKCSEDEVADKSLALALELDRMKAAVTEVKRQLSESISA